VHPQVVFASDSGGASQPEQDSLESKVAKEAEQKNDPRWIEVLRKATSGIPKLTALRPTDFKAVFVPGGASALRNLRQTNMGGSSPSAFCQELQRFSMAVLQADGVVGATGHGTRGLPVLPPEVAASCKERLFSGEFDSAATQTAHAMVQALAAAWGPPESS
jgi:putative intracellular protease/amidase